jgi:alginate O-acetyltransferase complex protein AlgI
MLFNSLEFLLFFPIVTILFFILPHNYRWLLLLIASCIFYMFFIPQYIFILFTTIVIDYTAGIWIEKTSGKKKKRWLIVSIISTILVLFIFKYFNFFNHNMLVLSHKFGFYYPEDVIKVILPIGLSFHTFQSLSYVIEVYYGNYKAEKHFGIYSLYVMFYPQLVAGPIERPGNLLPQFRRIHSFEYTRVTQGLKLMFWGFFQKIVIADTLSLLVNTVYDTPGAYQGLDVWLATFFFGIQIYCDFAGYTNIAKGAATVMGFNLMNNFNLPYFSKSFSEFWRRWHISLSSWFRDYLYIPLGGNRVKTRTRFIFTIMFVFMVSGFWHGAGWTYIIWGALHGIYYLSDKYFPFKWLSPEKKINQLLKMLFVFALVNFAWIFFRSKSVTISMILVENSFNLLQTSLNFDKLYLLKCFSLIGILFVVSLIERKKDIVSYISEKPFALRWSVYYISAILLIAFGNYGIQEFIYFRF